MRVLEFYTRNKGLTAYHNASWASYQIRKIAGCACAGNAGNVFPRRRFQRKPLVSDPGMHHGTCVTHVPWCMSGSLTCGDGENIPGIPGACAPAILRIWQEAHWLRRSRDLSASCPSEESFKWLIGCCRYEYDNVYHPKDGVAWCVAFTHRHVFRVQ